MHRISFGLLVLSGCSPELTCELLDDPSNCFAQTAVALGACMPMRATTATLSSDETTCTFADGVSVVFNYPVPRLAYYFPAPGGVEFTIYSADGSSCGYLHYFRNVNDDISTSAGTDTAHWVTPAHDEPYELACSSQTYTGYINDDQCDWANSPAFVYKLEAGPRYTFTVQSAATPSVLFSCQ